MRLRSRASAANTSCCDARGPSPAVDVSDGHLFVDRKPVVRRERIACAYIDRIASPPELACLDDRGERVATVASVDLAELERTLEALGFDDGAPAFRVLALPREEATATLSVLGATIIVAMAVGVAAGDPEAARLFTLPLALLVYATVALLPSDLAIGSEGLRFTWLWRERIISFSDVTSVVAAGHRLELFLASGEAVPLEVLRSASDTEDGAREAARLTRSLMVSLQRYGVGSAADHQAAAMLARDGRSAWAWLFQIRALTAAGYRGAALVPERLSRILEDPSAAADARVAAAALMRGAMDSKAVARLRVLARSSVVPALRVAFDAIAEANDDDDLLAALDGCAAET